MRHDPQKIEEFFKRLSSEQVEESNRRGHEEHIRQVTAFREGYTQGICYLCGNSFDQKRSEQPCLHWLLRRTKVKKNEFPEVFKKFDYHNVASFLRWCANEERLLKNINDLADEKSSRKVISYTVKWKNVDWTFDFSENDLKGHEGTHISFPHYHFQMRIDGLQFINFNDFHFAFSDRDLFMLSLRDRPWLNQNFGAAGSGMQDAVSVDLEKILDLTESSESKESAQYHFSTLIEAGDQPISGDEIHDMLEEAKRTKKSFAYIAKKRFKGRARVQTTISPVDDIPDIAVRTEHKPR